MSGTELHTLHKYWSKKPLGIIRQYVEAYTASGEIVLDPFMGSGTGCIAAVQSGRRTMGIDINPAAVLIARTALACPHPEDIEPAFDTIRVHTYDRIDRLYHITTGGRTRTGTHFVYKDGRLLEVWHMDRTSRHVPASMVRQASVPRFRSTAPRVRLTANARLNVQDGMTVRDLFTERNALALSYIKREVDRIENHTVREFFQVCFTACTGQASRMVFVIHRNGTREVGSWTAGYWRPREYIEVNAWNCFASKYTRMLRAAKAQTHRARLVRGFSRLSGGDALLSKSDARTSLSRLPDRSVHYVITDPPHGNRVPYLELSAMWNAWLGHTPNMSREVVISHTRSRSKGTEEYLTRLGRILSECVRVLKPRRYMTLMFNSTNRTVWNGLQSILYGLDLECVRTDTIGYDAKTILQRTRPGALPADFIMTFRRGANRRRAVRTVPRTADEDMIRDVLSRHAESGRDALPRVMTGLMRRRMIFDVPYAARLAS